MIWRIAWRNLWRHRGRTFILSSVIAGTYGATLLGISIGDDSHQSMLEEAVLAAGGDVLVHGAGYWETLAGDIIIADADEIVAAVRSTRGVATAFPRVIVSGLVSTSAASRSVFLQGVEPGPEAAWQDLAADVTSGSFLEEDRSDPLVLGWRLARRLEAELGDRVVLTASGPDGELTRALFHLTGILTTGSREFDEVAGYTTVEAARRAVSMEGALTQVGILLLQGSTAEEVAESLRRELPTGVAGLEVLTWREAVPEMVGFIELDDGFGYLYLTVIFVVVLFAITNTFLMAVMERVRELGLLNALGLKGARVGQLLLAETLLLTGLAMVAGLAMGFGGHLAVDHWGLNLAAYGFEEMEISGVDFADMVIRSSINPTKWLAASLLVVGASLTSALYPAWRAARLAPAEAMRFFE